MKFLKRILSITNTNSYLWGIKWNKSEIGGFSEKKITLQLPWQINGGFCLFLQGLKGVPGRVNGGKIRELVAEIVDHRCDMCGSVPIWFKPSNLPNNNNPGSGILTANYVSTRVQNGVACNGLCGAHGITINIKENAGGIVGGGCSSLLECTQALNNGGTVSNNFIRPRECIIFCILCKISR